MCVRAYLFVVSLRCSDKMFGSINRKLKERDVWCLDDFAQLVR